MVLLVLVILSVCSQAAIADIKAPDCTKCNYSIGGIGYLPVPGNCAKFYQCRKNPNHAIDRVELCCPEPTGWDENTKTCSNFWCNGTWTGCPNTTHEEGRCKLWADSNDQKNFIVEHGYKVLKCPAGTIFRQENCSCVHSDHGDSCYSDPLLHFPFEKDFNDIQCPKAIGTPHGNAYIEALNSSQKFGASGYMVCLGDGDYMTFGYLNNWFENNKVHHMTISLFFWQTKEGFANGPEGLFSNGNCDGNENIYIYLQNGNIQARFQSASFQPGDDDEIMRRYTAEVWCTVTLTYDRENQTCSLSLNEFCIGERHLDEAIIGTMSDSSLCVAYIECVPHFFKGLMDDLIVFVRFVSDLERRCIFSKGRTCCNRTDVMYRKSTNCGDKLMRPPPPGAP